MEISDELAVRTKTIETVLLHYLPKEEGLEGSIYEAMRYSVMAGGKRIRPMLLMETYRVFGGTSTVIEPFMAALEMIHTYSLVHDDLPAMDDDALRRGKPTTHVVFGEAMGVLAGDALLNCAMEKVLSAFYIEPENEQVLPCVRLLFHKAGTAGMIGGQVVDVTGEKTGATPDMDTLTYIYEKKTAALIEAAMMIGAKLAGASEEAVADIGRAARNIGLAFQIEDDILDITGDERTLGKPVGSDEKNHKTTMATCLGIEEAKGEVERLMEEAKELLLRYVKKDDFLMRLTEALIGRTR